MAKPLTKKEDGPLPAKNIFIGGSLTGAKIFGKAALDLSYRPVPGVIFSFDNISQMEFSGFHVINSYFWTCCSNVFIRDLMLIGYKTFSDGVMLSDCKDVTVSGCFVRTGDDALKVKSISGGSVKTENVLFKLHSTQQFRHPISILL